MTSIAYSYLRFSTQNLAAHAGKLHARVGYPEIDRRGLAELFAALAGRPWPCVRPRPPSRACARLRARLGGRRA
jgi:hypothetical protein